MKANPTCYGPAIMRAMENLLPEDKRLSLRVLLRYLGGFSYFRESNLFRCDSKKDDSTILITGCCYIQNCHNSLHNLVETGESRTPPETILCFV